jgi:trans-2-enoyl-CoA reductase
MAARKGRGNTVVTYHGNTLTDYCNTAELSATVDRLEATHFGSTAAETIAGDMTYSINIGGDWDVQIDTWLAPEVITNVGTERNATIAFSGASQTVTYTWTSNAEISDWTITSGASDKITWSATLVLNGTPTRSVA